MPTTPLSPLARIPDDLKTLADYERRAEAHMEPAAWRHLQEGAGAGQTIAHNRIAFDGMRLVPRVLADLGGATTRVDLFGLSHAAPILLAPLAYHRIAHPQGEVATITGATALDTSMVVSTLSSVAMEELASAAQGAAAELGRTPPPLWFQLYCQPDRGHTLELVRRAESAGYRILVVTVDAAIKRSEFALPPGVDAANLRGMPRPRQHASAAGGKILFGTPFMDGVPTWDTLAWLRSVTKLPIVVKGVLAPEDAGRAMDIGMDGLIVSNHGGRVMDGLVHPLEVLPAVLAAVDDRGPVLLDSGVRTGVDVLRALALGARAVLIGRPQIHALAVAGMAGVAHMLHILRVELEMAMAQTGCTSVGSISPQLLAGPASLREA